MLKWHGGSARGAGDPPTPDPETPSPVATKTPPDETFDGPQEGHDVPGDAAAQQDVTILRTILRAQPRSVLDLEMEMRVLTSVHSPLSAPVSAVALPAWVTPAGTPMPRHGRRPRVTSVTTAAETAATDVYRRPVGNGDLDPS